MINFYFGQSSSIDWTTIILSLLSAIVGALIAGFYSLKATKSAFQYNQKLKEDEEEKQSYLTLGLLQKIYKEVYIILKAFAEPEIKRSLYGYISSYHFSTKSILPLIHNAMNNIDCIKNQKAQNLAIELYAKLQNFLELNMMYKNSLERLKEFRKKSLEKDPQIKIIVFDFFNVEERLIKEENRAKPRLHKDFIEQHKILIDDLINKSNIIEKLYYLLNKKIEDFLEINNERI